MRLTPIPRDTASVFAISALSLPIVAVAAPLGVAPLAGATALLVALAQFRERSLGRIDRTALITIALFSLWSAVSALWSLDPARSLSTTLRVTVICFGGIVLITAATNLDARQRARVARALKIGALTGAAIAALILAYGIFIQVGVDRLFEVNSMTQVLKQFNRTGSIVAVAAWLLAAIPDLRRHSLIGIVVVVTAALLLFEPEVPLIAFATGGLIYLIALWRPRRIPAFLSTCLVVFLLTLPVLPQFALQLDSALTAQGLNANSVSHRLGIWSFSIGRALDRPFTGWGMGASREVPGASANLSIQGEPGIDAPSIPLHPHNAAVQLWLELGLPGLFLAAFLVLRGLLRTPRAVDGRRALAVRLAVATGLLAIGNLSYGIWQGWWLCFIWLSIALTLALTTRPAPD